MPPAGLTRAQAKAHAWLLSRRGFHIAPADLQPALNSLRRARPELVERVRLLRNPKHKFAWSKARQGDQDDPV